MIDLSTKYMGFDLKNPIIAASSGMTDSVDKIKNLELNGVSAIVLKSLFEEQVMMEISEAEAANVYNNYDDAEDYISYYTKKYHIDNYLKLIEQSKDQAEIPIIASLNCFSVGKWIDFAQRIESAGADALELNMFILPGDQKFSGRK